MSAPAISVIVPVLNEAARIDAQLAELQNVPGLLEVIVVDGGSGDDTVALAERSGWTQVVRAPPGRASQMNAGARAARGDVLLFLHADVALPRDAAAWVQRALADPGVVAGAFRTWTVRDDSVAGAALWLHLADLRSRVSHLPYGDQALFVRARVFFDLGGFAPVPLMEDLELSRRLARAGRIRIVPARVRVSGRRFVARPLRYTLLVNVFPLLYRLGVSPERLARLYHDVR